MNDSQKLAAVLEMLEKRSTENDAEVDKMTGSDGALQDARTTTRSREAWKLLQAAKKLVEAS